MAKINGFELKGVKEFKGHEGEPCYQGNIYLNGKKVGYFSSSYTMGPMDIRFDKAEIEVLFKKTAEEYIKNFPEQFDGSGIMWPENSEWFDEEMLIYELLSIKDWENLTKREFKNGYTSVVMLFNMEGIDTKQYVEDRTTGRLFRESVSADYQPPKNHKLLRIITNLDQFNIAF